MRVWEKVDWIVDSKDGLFQVAETIERVGHVLIHTEAQKQLINATEGVVYLSHCIVYRELSLRGLKQGEDY